MGRGEEGKLVGPWQPRHQNHRARTFLKATAKRIHPKPVSGTGKSKNVISVRAAGRLLQRVSVHLCHKRYSNKIG